MGTSIVRNIVKQATGVVVTSGTATIELYGISGNLPGFVDLAPDYTSDYTIHTSGTANISGSGLWTATLQGNADISPAGTLYKVTEAVGTVSRVYYIDVPNDGGTYWVGNILDTSPVVSGTEFALGELSDVKDSLAPNDTQVFTYVSANSQWEAADAAGEASLLTIPNVQGTHYTLVLDDAFKAIEMNSSDPVNLTVPPNSSVAFSIGAVVEIYQHSPGQVTVVAGGGVTIRTPATLKLAGQFSTASLRKRETDEWVLAGDLEVA